MKASTTYTLPAGSMSTYYTAETGTAGFSLGLIKLGISIDGTLSSRIGTTNFGIEHTYRPTPEAVVVGVAAISIATGQWYTLPALGLQLAK